MKNNNPICLYCNKPSEKVTGREVYPHRRDLYNKIFYRCVPCGAYVGCHPGTDRPLGRLANAELRKAKSEAHSLFDPLWKSGQLSRGSAYHWLQKQLGISQKECHIGMFSLELCQKAIEACKKRNQEHLTTGSILTGGPLVTPGLTESLCCQDNLTHIVI